MFSTAFGMVKDPITDPQRTDQVVHEMGGAG